MSNKLDAIASTLNGLTLAEGHAALNAVCDSLGVQEVLEALIDRLITSAPGEVFANGSAAFQRDTLATVEALLVRHCGERV